MNKPDLFKTSHPVVILLLGLLIAQAVATIHVYLSNLNLYQTLTEVHSAGYLALPNRHVMVSLPDLGPAFWGGLFFTFTVGTGCSLGGMAAGWIWVRLFECKRSMLVLMLLVWGLLLVWLNHNGFSLMPTLYFLLIGPAVFYLTARRESMTAIQSNRIKRLINILPVPLLAMLWFTQYDNNMFLDLRDNLLLSNTYGRKFSNFYYTYTLYPAEAFKALNQKTIKTGNITKIHSRSINERIDKKLIADDYLPIPNAADADLVIKQDGKSLVFQTDGRQVVQIPIDQFLNDPRIVLRKFSDECDRNAIFRQFTFQSLLIGFPLSIYMVVHAVFYYLGYFIFGRNNSALTASIICLLFGTLVLIFFQSNRSRNIQVPDISNALASARWQTRVAALKLIEQKKLDIASYPIYPILQQNRTPQERYWLARTLRFSRPLATYKVLLEFLNDDNLNVRTMSLNSLGLRRDKRAIRPILLRVENSASWYEQMYAYKTLRALGWKQTRSR